MYQIVDREVFSDTTFRWDVFAPDVAQSARPGQFIMLRLHDGGERIPLTIADFDRRLGTVTLVVQALGKSTAEMLANYDKGDWFLDFVGPLGLASDVEEIGHVVMVGGGLGVAPIFPQLRAFKEAGNRVTGIIGFRSEEHIFWQDRFAEYCDELIVCTDDGSYGKEGFVTVALQEVAEKDPIDLCVAIGPLPMMRACAEVTRPFSAHTIVSLNAIMVDGTGMCGSCRVTVDGKIRFACVDGPDFDAHKVAFDELIARQNRFKAHEQKSQADYDHVCNLEQKLIVDGKRNYQKFKHVTPHARPMPERDATERSGNFLEVNLGYTMDDAMAEAARCIQCKRPTCVSGCPVGIDIPRFLRHLIVRDLAGAQAAIHDSNLFPAICGRVCPQESQCEAQCILVKKMEPVAIGRLERFVGDHAPPADARVPDNAGTLGKVAIVGSGPSGLACAGDLARSGAAVTVYEALHVVGGVLRYGIPSFRLPRSTIDREVAALEKLGVRFEVNKVVGKTFTLEQLRGEMGYDAVYVATGAGYPIFLGIDGESAGQVYSANEFLTRVNLMAGDKFPYADTPVAMGERIVVLGAGNTAMDCLRTSRRLGAPHVHCVYRRSEAEAPARIEELRHAKEEGIQFHFLRSPAAILVDDDGEVTGLRCQVMKLGEPDDSGRRRPQAVEGEFETIPCDTVIYALGTRANPIVPQSAPDLALNKWGYIEADGVTQATNLPGVFAGGDIVTGGATVILALGAGRRAAKAMGVWLQEQSWPPVLPDEEEATAALAAAANSCPRCQGPLDGDESYICCAGETVRWRCQGCHKVSEGFAFPFGLCPACGGELLRLDKAGDSNAASREVIQLALQIELGGQAFYERGAAATDDPELRELFVRLAAMEQEHVSTLARRYHVSPPQAGAGVDTDSISVYAGVEPNGTDPISLLELAVVLERRARDFFADKARELPDGSEQWRLCRELEAEEWEHVAMMETELERYKAGERGVL